MRRLPCCKLAILVLFSAVVILLYTIRNGSKNDVNSEDKYVNFHSIKSSSINQQAIDRVVISFVVCDSRYNESLNVVKSVLIFTRIPVLFVIFTDNNLKPKLNHVLSQWKSLTDKQLDFELHEISFPEPHKEDWLNLFSKCAAQRLFIPKLITHIDALMYLDTDTLFLGPADKLWSSFFKFNSTQISAMAVEHVNPNLSWYPRFAKHPFYGNLGLNSGVMLMNLTRMRDFGWADYVTPVMLKWKLYIPWGDQDIINIIFHHHQSAVLELSCRYNYRSDQCKYGDACADATRHGVFVLHGSRKAFHNHNQPAFEAIYRAVEEYEVGSDPSESFLVNLEKYLNEAPQSACGNLKDAFLKVPVETFNQSKSFVLPDR